MAAAFVIPCALGAGVAFWLKSRAGAPSAPGPAWVVDSSALIDGRLVGIAVAGFLDGRLVIPRFVLGELQHLADSADADTRVRGRRGLDAVRELQDRIPVEILDSYGRGEDDVDSKLVAMALAMGAGLVTNDFNLNKVASVQGVSVRNVNELACALTPLAKAGDTLEVRIVRAGTEPGQGVAYLDDGTMVVVENGVRALAKTAQITVSHIRQTAAGKMIFARLHEPRLAARSR